MSENEGEGPRFVRPEIVPMQDLTEHQQEQLRAQGADPLEVQVLQLFVTSHAERFRYNTTRSQWMEWTGFFWRIDELGRSHHEMMRIVERVRLVDPANRRTLGKVSFATNALRGAQSHPSMAIRNEDFDQDPNLIGTPNGFVNLKTGKLHNPDPAKLISKITKVAPTDKANCKMWKEFLLWACGNDQELMDYLQRFLGYCLSGLMQEEIMTFVYGPGGNGKGVMISVLSHILGDYYKSTPSSTFMDTKRSEHASELARLDGVRLVSASETGIDDKWNLARIKEVTGNENPISARFMRQDFFEFWAVCKLIIVGNNKPQIGEVDPAITRRMRMIEFKQTPKVADKTLKDRMAKEYGGILRWMIDGFKMYQKDGLEPPESVIRASGQYLRSEDVVQQFLNDWCEIGSDMYVLLKKDIGLALMLWGKENGVSKRIPATRVYKRLIEGMGLPGGDGDRYHNKRCFFGIRLNDQAWDAIKRELAKENKTLDEADGRRGIPIGEA